MSTFIDFCKKMTKVLIKNLYMNENTCGSPSNTRNRQISQILETAPNHATEYN